MPVVSERTPEISHILLGGRKAGGVRYPCYEDLISVSPNGSMKPCKL